MKFALVVLLVIACLTFLSLSTIERSKVDVPKILTGAEQVDKYLPLLKNKRIAIMANQTSMIGKTHLVDSLKTLGVNVVKVFGPEHGFRGNASAGTAVSDEVDARTGIPVISLYGKKNKPTAADLADIDIVLYDLQDVGVRFYTN